MTFDVALSPVFSAGGHEFALEKILEAPTDLWALAFLPDGSLLATQKNGEPCNPAGGAIGSGPRRCPGSGIAAKAGLLDVQPHPDCSTRGLRDRGLSCV